MLRKLKGLNRKETAAELGISEKTVDVHLSRGLRKLEEKLGAQGRARALRRMNAIFNHGLHGLDTDVPKTRSFWPQKSHKNTTASEAAKAPMRAEHSRQHAKPLLCLFVAKTALDLNS